MHFSSRRKTVRYLLTSIAFCLLMAASAYAGSEKKVISFDTKTHDFGDVIIADGPISCTFTFTNISDSPIVIHNVVSSCGCTTPDWTREPVRPGEKGFVKATYTNDTESTFNKALTVYVSGVDRPVILRLKGETHGRRMKYDELFTVRTGEIGFRRESFSLGYVDQGSVKEDSTPIANFSSSPVNVEAVAVSSGLKVRVSPNPVPAKGTAKLFYTVDLSTTDKNIWGTHLFSFKIASDGKTADKEIRVKALIKKDFDGMSREDRALAPKIELEKSYFEFGEIKKGEVRESSFILRNKGKQTLEIYSIDSQSPAASVNVKLPLKVAPGAETQIDVRYDSSKCASAGEVVDVLSAVTNAPDKPVLNLYVTGIVSSK